MLGLFGMSLFAFIATVGVVQDAVYPAWTRFYEDPAESHDNMTPPPAQCLDSTGINACVAVALAMDGETGVVWGAAWSIRDENLVCVDRETADLRVDCDAADAVQSRLTPMLSPCVRTPSGQRECRPTQYRQLPWRSAPES